VKGLSNRINLPWYYEKTADCYYCPWIVYAGHGLLLVINRLPCLWWSP